MQHISFAIPKSEKKPEKKIEKKDRSTERGEMMQYFLKKLNSDRGVHGGMPLLTMGRMGRLLVAIPTKDLYYIRTVCDQSANFAKKFWWEINPKKHDPSAPPKPFPKKSREQDYY